MKDQETKPPQGFKTICLPFESEDLYQRCLGDAHTYRHYLCSVHQLHPELFPVDFGQGFTFRGNYRSEKMGFELKRLKLKSSGETYLMNKTLSDISWTSAKVD